MAWDQRRARTGNFWKREKRRWLGRSRRNILSTDVGSGFPVARPIEAIARPKLFHSKANEGRVIHSRSRCKFRRRPAFAFPDKKARSRVGVFRSSSLHP